MNWLEQDDLTELRRRELEASTQAWRRYKTNRNRRLQPVENVEGDFDLRMGDDIKPVRDGFHKKKKCVASEDDVGNISSNIGIPEKKRGWELADIQYHGDQFQAGEW